MSDQRRYLLDALAWAGRIASTDAGRVVAWHDDGPRLTDAEYDALVAGWFAVPRSLRAPYEVPKLVIVDRLEAARLRRAAKTALAEDDYARDRWQAAVAIRSDDTQVGALLAAIGADVEAILTPASCSPAWSASSPMCGT